MMKTQTRLVPRTQHTTAITMIPVVGSLGAATPANRLYVKKWFRLRAQLQLKKLVPVHDLFRYGQTVVVFQVLLIRIWSDLDLFCSVVDPDPNTDPKLFACLDPE
jgi:hypothetical protein